MADGSYERRGPREAELKRLRRIIEESRRACAAGDGPSSGPAAAERTEKGEGKR